MTPPDTAFQRISEFGGPSRLGDFLGGLFALARESLATETVMTELLTSLVADWRTDEFLVALPALRQAFAWFPPRERVTFARMVLRHHGLGELDTEAEAYGWMRQSIGISDQAIAIALEETTARRLAQVGLQVWYPST